MHRAKSLAFLAAVLLAPLARAESTRTFSVVPEQSSISYKVVHKLHEVLGTSKAIEGKARVLPDGGVQVMVRVSIDSFDTGNGNRDAHLKEVVEAAKYPTVELKGVGKAPTTPASFPVSSPVTLKGLLTFHGVQKPVELTVKVTLTDATHATVEGDFPVSLDEYKIERPSLLFVKVDDKAVIDVKLSLKEDGR